jgi:Na+-driven multidrug efflux pump
VTTDRQHRGQKRRKVAGVIAGFGVFVAVVLCLGFALGWSGAELAVIAAAASIVITGIAALFVGPGRVVDDTDNIR